MVDNRYSGIGYEQPFEFADDPQDRAPMTEAIEEYQKLQAKCDTLMRDLKSCHESKARFGDRIIAMEADAKKLNDRFEWEMANGRKEFAELEAERDQLRAENDRLRELADDFSKAYTEIQRIITGSEGGCDETAQAKSYCKRSVPQHFTRNRTAQGRARPAQG